MTEERDTSIMLSGLTDAGKSTWLAALWQVFETDGFDSKLTLRRYLGEQRYIVGLNAAWTRCERFDRTSIKSPGSVAVELADLAGRHVKLEIPDLSGELFRDHWALRHWDPDFDREVKEADGLLLMVSTLTEGVLMLRDALEVGAADMEEIEVEGGGNAEEADEKPKWDPRKSPAQIKLVEHLQFIAQQRLEQPLPVAVMFSAWDQVRDAPFEIEPREWLRKEQPLLDQFLAANKEQFPCEVFGVSAQGGDLERDRDRLLAMKPIERLEVVDGTESTHDLTLPLAWVVSAQDG